MSELTYTIKDPSQLETDMPDQEIDLDSIEIESRGHVLTFTLGEMKENDAKAQKMLVECSANKDVQEATMKNIEEHNPFILEMSDEKLHACHMYFEAKALRNTYADKIKELEEFTAAEAADRASVLKQIPQLNVESN